MKSWGLSEKNNNSRILVAFYTSEVSKCNLVLRMSNVQSSKNVGGGFFYTTSAGNFLTFTNICKQCFRARFLNISVFHFPYNMGKNLTINEIIFSRMYFFKKTWLKVQTHLSKEICHQSSTLMQYNAI